MKRTRLCIGAAVTMAVLASGGAVTPAAGGPPQMFNDLFTSYPITVNGTYTPLVGDLDCTGAGGNLAVIWYAPGSAPDFRWTNLDSTAGGDLEYSTNPLTVNGSYAKPFVGDFDDDTCDDVFWYSP